MSRAKGRQNVPITPPSVRHTEDVPWHEVLDDVVEEHFKAWHLICQTRQASTGKWCAEVMYSSGSTLTPAMYKQVSSFIAGFMACEHSFDD